MYLTAANLAHYLMSRGLVAADGIVDGDFTAFESRRRNRNYRVTRTKQPSLFIKQVPMIVAETTSSLRREATCYRIAAEIPEFTHLQDLMPRVLDYNSLNHTIVTELISGGENLNEYHQRAAAFPQSIAELQAHVLARLHSGTANLLPHLDKAQVFERNPPWVFTILQNAESVMPDAQAPMKELVALLRQRPDIATALLAMQHGWQPVCLIHGDIKWDNFVLAGDVLRLVDWELADIGDPAWDVACIFASYLQPWLFTLGNATVVGPVATNGQGVEVTWPALNAFWHTYVRAMNLGGPAADRQLLRSVYYLGGRLVLTAFEMVNGATEVYANVHSILDLARHVLLDPQMALLNLVAIRTTAPGMTRSRKTPTHIPLKPRAAAARLSAEDLPRPLRERLMALLESVDILSPNSFRFANNETIVMPPAEAAPADRLVEALWPVVYTTCYTRDYRVTAVSPLEIDLPAPQSDPPFVAMLSAANRTRARWDPAWEVYQIGVGGTVHVRKGDSYRLAKPGEYAYTAGPGLAPGVGAWVDLLVLRESHAIQQGFYFAFGETVPSEFDDSQLSRIYFNAAADGVCGLFEFLSTELNRFSIPYRFKCLDNRAAYEKRRADAAVLYVAKRFAPLTLSIVHGGRDRLASFVHDDVPLFTKEILPGVGAADEPHTGESFGQSRMRLVSRGIVDAWTNGRKDVRSRFEAVNARFLEAGISLARPYLNGGNSDMYDIPFREVSH